MASQMSWGKLGESNQRSNGKVNNMKLENGVQVVRFVGEPIEFHKYFVNGKSAVTADPKTCPVKAKYGIEPNTRYAINVIDRKDGQLKVLECSITVLKPVVSWGNIAGRDPGGENSVDFAIDAQGAGKNRRYNTIALKESPLTEAEKKLIKETGGTDTGYDLNKLYKAVPENEIENRLFGNAKPAVTAQAPAQAVAANVGQTTQVKNVDIPF
jgi:hypothetical protein